MATSAYHSEYSIAMEAELKFRRFNHALEHRSAEAKPDTLNDSATVYKRESFA